MSTQEPHRLLSRSPSKPHHQKTHVYALSGNSESACSEESVTPSNSNENLQPERDALFSYEKPWNTHFIFIYVCMCVYVWVPTETR